MNLELNNKNNKGFSGKIIITGSKSESNRLLILQKMFNNLIIDNLSNSNDTKVLRKALTSTNMIVNVGHAGTAMRFLTAYYASVEGVEITITGSKRMQERPIKILVDALNHIGADVKYLNKEGFPPLQIKGKEITKSNVTINGNVSSQYISALLLIAPTLKNGLTISLQGKVTSIPYIKMTLNLLNQIGITTNWNNDTIQIFAKNKIDKKTIVVESDWSSASYYYSLVALSNKSSVELSYFKEKSLQGDKALDELFLNFGVKTTFKKDTILLEKIQNFKQKKHVKLNLVNTPDIAQTIAVTCVGLNVSCGLEGLHTLKIKETDRLEALKIELSKFDAKIRITNNSIHIKPTNLNFDKKTTTTINTYQDHRMAMAFAPLSLKYPIKILNAEVVNKSYPNFWNDFKKITNQ